MLLTLLREPFKRASEGVAPAQVLTMMALGMLCMRTWVLLLQGCPGCQMQAPLQWIFWWPPQAG